MMTFAEEKRKRVHTILQYIIENPKTSKDKLIAHFCLEWGLRHQKIAEYLAELEALDYIKLEPKESVAGRFDVIDYIVYATNEGKAKMKEFGEEKDEA